jgi:hypothetical protein
MNNNNTEQYAVINADKYIVLPDGRMARLLKSIKVSKYNYYTYRTNDGKVKRVNVESVDSVRKPFSVSN